MIKKRHLFRLILPAFTPFNIYTSIAKTTTALGPVYVGTAAHKLPNWDVEIIDENNCRSKFCPKDENGYPDHAKLQKERPADVVGFYGSMTSAIPRMYKVAQLYKELGATTLSGGYHVRNLPEEALLNGIDIVFQGEAENVIREVLRRIENNKTFDGVSGIIYSGTTEIKKETPMSPIKDLDMLPYPDFNLVRYAKLVTYPVGRTRGCNQNCEFCAVKDKSRCASPEWMMGQIAHLVETRKARRFFDVSDHFTAEGVDQSIQFCRLMKEYQEKHKVSLHMTVQIRLNDARHEELLVAMREAGIYNLAIGIESCIDGELKIMRKGYGEKDVIKWIKIYQSHGFYVHGMMIFGYPNREERKVDIPIKQRLAKFREFIKYLDTAQILFPVPLPGTELTDRLRKEDRLYDLPYEYYDGQFLLFEPDEGIDAEELQGSVINLMGGFYKPNFLLQLIKAILVFFPSIIFPRVITLATLRVRYIVEGFHYWYSKHFRNNAVRFGGSFLVKSWKKYFAKSDFMKQMREARAKLKKD